MANVNIRKLDDSIYRDLRIQAAQNGHSIEEEARQIITRAVCAPTDIGAIFTSNFGAKNGFYLKVHSDQTPHQPMNLSQVKLVFNQNSIHF